MGKYAESSVEFSPSGNRFLATICDDKELYAFNSSDFKKLEQWTQNEYQYIQKARWIDEDRILAGYKEPGDFLVFQMGKKQPISKISPGGLEKSAITDFDFSRDRRFVFGGSNFATKLVFKVAIDGSSNSLKWRHTGHSSWINSVRLSSNERLVLSTGADQKAVLASAEGTVLATFNQFTNKSVLGCLWCPGDKKAFVLSGNELILLELSQDLKTLKKIEELKKEEIGFALFTGLNGFFGGENRLMESQKPFLIIGGKHGRLVRLPLK